MANETNGLKIYFIVDLANEFSIDEAKMANELMARKYYFYSRLSQLVFP